ncbi:MAG: nicotinate-nucleotide--dimethylbenzimidazole phosphoribosyltransferase [Propionibacteriaceae bacterium]
MSDQPPFPPIAPPSARATREARKRLRDLAQPIGALGRLEDLAAWLAGVQGRVPPEPPARVRAVVLAGDHGITDHDLPGGSVSAYPKEVTPAMVRAFVAGVAGVSVLARQHDVALRVLDLGVDADLSDLPGVTTYKITRSTAPLHLTDALTPEQTRAGLAAGDGIATAEISAGADLLILGDMGIGNTTPAAALIAAGLGLTAADVTGRGTGVDDPTYAHKVAVIDRALMRVGARVHDPVERLTALGSADLAAGVGFLLTAARAGVPVLLDGIVSVAELTVAADLDPGVVAWCAAGHRSTEPAQQLALAKLGLEPILDLGLRLGEGSGAVAAVPLVRSAALLLRDMALLSDLG